jgi:hypothetical protein
LPDDDRMTGRQSEPDERMGLGHRPAYPVAAVGRRSTYGFRTAGRRGAAVPPALLEGGEKRRMVEFLMPASVILAGVLIVIAFGFIINRAMHDDDNPAAIPLPQPPALGTVPADPTDQAVIPLPSPSATGKPSSPPVSTSPTKKPPARKQPPFTGSISLTQAGAPGLVDLSAEGSRDWVHWGEESTFSLERDKNGGFAILEGAPKAPRFRHGLSPQRFSWQGGSPVDHSDGTPTGIRTCGKNNGFTISAPATTGNRTLRLYAGVLAGRGRLEAKLSTGGATKVSYLEQRANKLTTTVFVLTYRAPKNGKLNLNWVTEASFNSDCGGVALEAATLR